MKIAKSAKTLLTAAIVAFAASTAINANAKTIKVTKGVTQNEQGFVFERHPLLIGDHKLEVQGGVIKGSKSFIQKYQETDGPLVGIYCLGGYQEWSNSVLCKDERAQWVTPEELLSSRGFRAFVRYSNTFSDEQGNDVEALLGCRADVPFEKCESYVGN